MRNEGKQSIPTILEIAIASPEIFPPSYSLRRNSKGITTTADMPSTNSAITTNCNFDAVDLFELINPSKLSLTCVGYAPSQGRRCWNPIAKHNVDSGKALLRDLPSLKDKSSLELRLQSAAACLLCRHYHQGQSGEVADKWYKMIKKHVHSTSEVATSSSSNTIRNPSEYKNSQGTRDQPKATVYTSEDASDDALSKKSVHELILEQQLAIMQAQVEQLSAIVQTQAAIDVKQEIDSSEEVEHRDVDDMDEDKTEDNVSCMQTPDGSTIDEEEDKNTESRRTVEPGFRASIFNEAPGIGDAPTTPTGTVDRTASSSATATPSSGRRGYDPISPAPSQLEHHDWDAEWTRYQSRWADLSRRDASTLPASIRSSLPWPVRGGRWQDVTLANVEDFFTIAPGAITEDDAAFSRMLRRQAMRWRPARISDRFGVARTESETVRLAGVVYQAIAQLV